MAQFETMVPADRASVFNSMLWEFIARMLGCSVPVTVVRRYPHADGDRWVVEMDDQARLDELKAETLARIGAH